MVHQNPLYRLVVGLKGAGDLASGVAWRLYQANIREIFMMEIPQPLAVRRSVSFSEAVPHGLTVVEGVEAVRVEGAQEIRHAWERGQIPVVVDPRWSLIGEINPGVVVDATMAKRNLGTTMNEAPLVIGLGLGFTAGVDVHMVIETNRGHNLGRIILSGNAEPDTGVPVTVGGYSSERVLRAPANGLFKSRLSIGDIVERGEIVGDVYGNEVRAGISGVIRGLISSEVQVTEGLKLGDIDPRGDASYCHTISDKSRAIGGAVLEAILRVCNK